MLARLILRIKQSNMSLLFTLCVFCAILQWATVSLNVPLYTLEGKNALQQRDIGIQVHSRKRRYLIFPQGSSFQVVWDGIIGIVDYTNYLILGITVALAWELPSQPPSEILADIKQNLFNDDVNNVPLNTTPLSGYLYESPSQPNAERKVYLNTFKSAPYKKNAAVYYTKPKRYEYPKRSLKAVHQRHHRNSRFKLYGSIEKYLEKRDIHGHHCVLRALCERHQKHTQQQQQQQKHGLSFMAALMQTIFSLPERLADEVVDYRRQRYDKAHAFQGKCEERYRNCKYSLWSSPYLQ